MDFTSRESSTAEPSLSIRWQSCSLHHNFAAACRLSGRHLSATPLETGRLASSSRMLATPAQWRGPITQALALESERP